MLPPVFQTLKASSAVMAIVGGSTPQIWRSGRRPQPSVDDAREPLTRQPYITWFRVGAEPQNHLSGTPPADRIPVQIDCWHGTEQGAHALSIAVRDAIEPRAHMTGLVADGKDVETGIYRVGLQFDWWLMR